MFTCTSFLKSGFNNIPDVGAIYLLSQSAKLIHIGNTTNLYETIRQHYCTKTIEFNQKSLMHWVEINNGALTKDLIIGLNPEKHPDTYESLLVAERIFRRHYLALIDRWVDLIPDQPHAALRIYKKILGYWRTLADYQPQHEPSLREWTAKTRQMEGVCRRLAS